MLIVDLCSAAVVAVGSVNGRAKPLSHIRKPNLFPPGVSYTAKPYNTPCSSPKGINLFKCKKRGV